MSDTAMAEGRAPITIQGMIFEAKQPYIEGHILTAVEASVLNQTYAENLRNNFAQKIRDMKTKLAKETLGKSEVTKEEVDAIENSQLDQAELQREFEDYAENYEFGARRGGRVLDPVERELWSIAETIVKNALKAKNIKLNSVSAEKMDSLVQGVIENKPELREEAERRVSVTRQAASVELGSLA